MKARRHISAGTIIFKDSKSDTGETEREYLLLYYTHQNNSGGYWDFPKGTAEEGESLIATAIREAKEETNLDIEIIDGFKEKIKYIFREKNILVFKIVVFFLAKAKSDNVIISDEHSDFIWLPYEKTLAILKYKTAKEILEKSEKFLKIN